jgi:hypothetical protein
MKLWRSWRRLFVPLLLAQSVFAANMTSEAALQRFQSLAGKWSIQSGGKTLAIEMNYEVASKGTIVTEQFGRELSVFYRDGGDLLMTHFCNGGTQPRLRWKKDSPPGAFEFDMFDITNLASPEAAHVDRILYRVLDEKTLDLEIVWKTGKAESTEKYTLKKL